MCWKGARAHRLFFQEPREGFIPPSSNATTFRREALRCAESDSASLDQHHRPTEERGALRDPRLRKEEGLSVMKRTDLTLDDVDHAGRDDESQGSISTCFSSGSRPALPVGLPKLILGSISLELK